MAPLDNIIKSCRMQPAAQLGGKKKTDNSGTRYEVTKGTPK